jgi:CheY-like chemotaxis protein
VLLVDDNPQAIELLAAHFAALPVEVLRAYSGAEAIKAAQCTQLDLVILDLLMPGMGGFEVMEALRQSPDTAGVPVLVVTAKDLSAEERERLNGRVLSVVQKAQFDGAHFTAEVRRALGRSGGSSSGGEDHG